MPFRIFLRGLVLAVLVCRFIHNADDYSTDFAIGKMTFLDQTAELELCVVAEALS